MDEKKVLELIKRLRHAIIISRFLDRVIEIIEELLEQIYEFKTDCENFNN